MTHDGGGEFEFIARATQHGIVRPDGVIQGVGDDCAVIETGDDRVMLVTTDMMIEDVHFRMANSAPEGIGYKLLSVNISDVAAMGGTPLDAFVSVGIPREYDQGIVERIFNGLHAGCSLNRVNLLGGDTTSSPGPLVLNLALTGRAQEEHVVFRSGGRPGDVLFVSGTLGDAAAGLQLLNGKGAGLNPDDHADLIRRHHRPEPRLNLGRALAEENRANAMIDLSDGLASDLRHLCARSRVRGIVDRSALPLSDALRRYCDLEGLDPTVLAMEGGEDYELLFAVEEDEAGGMDLVAHELGIRLTAVGRLERGEGVQEEAEGTRREMTARGFDHFLQDAATR